jgi:hypothetical protein
MVIWRFDIAWLHGCGLRGVNCGFNDYGRGDLAPTLTKKTCCLKKVPRDAEIKICLIFLEIVICNLFVICILYFVIFFIFSTSTLLPFTPSPLHPFPHPFAFYDSFHYNYLSFSFVDKEA